jgi:AcrR family transcriptional regulator
VPIWDLPERGTRGPKPRHDRAAIAAAAIRIADAEGAGALTMRRVASALGIATMSLYNYVPAKDHLIQLMSDQLAGEYTYPSAPVQALARAAASGQYPNLAAALAAAGPARGEDDVFESCIMRLIDVARPNDHASPPVR